MRNVSTRLLSTLLFALAAAGLAGCDADGSGGPSDSGVEEDAGADAGADSGPDPATFDDVEVTWFPCSLHEGADDGLAECASTPMPLFWDADDGRTFTVYAKRLLAPGESDGQLWLLHGGPGASGVIDFPPWMEQLVLDHPTLDVYTLDPRGTGYSEFAGCPDQEDEASAGGAEITPGEAPACAAYLEETLGDRLSVVGTTPAAMDLAAYVHHTREDGKRVLIWGGSGGTFWANRYLLMFPGGADGVVLEGIEPADGSIAFQDEYADRIGREILTQCADDAVCGEKLPEPVAALTDLYAALDGGHCPIGIDSALLALLVDYLEYYHPLHALIPSLVYRLTRCDDGDVAAIVQLFEVLFPQETGEALPSMSTVLFYNEMCSEIWDHASFADDAALVAYLDSVYADSIVPTGKGYDRNEICQAWPVYADARDDLFAETGVPLLMLEGVLDPATPHDFAVALADRFDGPSQTFVSMPRTAHNVLGGSPTADGDCGLSLFDAFIEDPEASLDTSCAEDVLPIDFTTACGLAATLYGTADCFENEPAETAAGASPPLDPRVELALRKAARAIAAALHRP